MPRPMPCIPARLSHIALGRTVLICREGRRLGADRVSGALGCRSSALAAALYGAGGEEAAPLVAQIHRPCRKRTG